MKIGILRADSVLEQFQAEFGDYPEMFVRLLRGQADRAELEFEFWDVAHEEFPDSIDACDAWLITGSRASCYDDEPWIRRLQEFVLQLHQHQKKLVGICFGHQLIASALGGQTKPAKLGWGVGVHTAAVTEHAEFMRPSTTSVSLLVSHKDQVVKLPAAATVLASSEFCPVSMFKVQEHILAVQGHPEFNKAYSRALMDMRREIIGDDVWQLGVESLKQPVDDEILARWILGFLGVSRTDDDVVPPRGFKSTRLKAEKYAGDRFRTADLLRRAKTKAEQRQGALGAVWDDLMTLFRLLRSWLDGEYVGLQWRSLVLVVTAILYFVMPIDVIPDFIAGLGFFDDAAIIAYVLSLIRDEVQVFKVWEAQMSSLEQDEESME